MGHARGGDVVAQWEDDMNMDKRVDKEAPMTLGDDAGDWPFCLCELNTMISCMPLCGQESSGGGGAAAGSVSQGYIKKTETDNQFKWTR